MIDRSKALQDPDFRDDLLDRFPRYARIETTSDRHVAETPSTPCQWELIHLLKTELEALGVSDLEVKDQGYLLARVPASPGLEGKPCIGLMAHVDTASDSPGKGVKPLVWKEYSGGPLALPAGKTLDASNAPELETHKGDTLITTDGSTLLGADDKAGLAEIMSVVRLLQGKPALRHGPLELIFTPDEETGKGLPGFDTAWLKATACYTFDGGALGEVESECFNAYEVKASFSGRVTHLGYARGQLANAVSMAADFASRLPRSESPEATDGWHGYYCPLEIKGELDKASVDVFLRDFSAEGMERRIEAVKAIARAVECSHPGGKVELQFVKQYLNMKGKLDEAPEVLAKLYQAAKAAGVEAWSKPIRGGTDGARLTEMGIPTPNVFTGSYNFHSPLEWASLSEMVLSARTLLNLVQAWAE